MVFVKQNLQRRWQKVQKKILSCKVNFSKYFLPLFFKMMLIEITFKDFYISEEDLIGREICKCFQCLPCLDCTVSRRTEIIFNFKRKYSISHLQEILQRYMERLLHIFCIRTLERTLLQILLFRLIYSERKNLDISNCKW